MKIYLYDDNFQFIKETYALINLEESRRQGKHIYSIPNNSTEIAPPNVSNNEKAFFIDGEWIIKKDYRGKKFFDILNNRTVIITELGDIPENYIDIGAKHLINYINKVEYEKLYNNVKGIIDKQASEKLNQKILIGKYLFKLNNIENYLSYFNNAINKIKQINKEILAIEKSIEVQDNIEKINQLKIEQLEKYKEIDSIQIKTIVENKRNKELEITFSFNDFKNIVKLLSSTINKIKDEQKNNLIKINKLSKYELVLFEQRLIKEEINHGDTKTKEDTQTNR